MARKRKIGRKRDRSGHRLPAPPAVDRGTPELQRRRSVILGATEVALSHESPVDVLAARRWFHSAHDGGPVGWTLPRGITVTDLVDAARDYQDAHRFRFGSISPRAMNPARDVTIPASTKTELLWCRRHQAWSEIVARQGGPAIAAVRDYVVLEQWDIAIRHIAAFGLSLDLDPIARLQLVALRTALVNIATAPAVIVTDADVEALKRQMGAAA